MQPTRYAKRKRSLLLRAVAASALVCASSVTFATGTPAGTQINNTATATYDRPGGGTISTNSNTVSLRVDELLDVTVANANGGEVTVQPGTAGQVLTFTITNTGNGNEAFRLSARNSLAGDDFDPAATAIYLDTNGDGDYDPGVDEAYVAASNDPLLAADSSATVFLVSSIPSGVTDGQRSSLDLLAVATTGSGAPGTTFAGQGQSGGDAVVGASGANAEDDGVFRVSAASVTFVKSAIVADPFGGTRAVPGAIITYQLVASVAGTGTLSNLRISDPIPSGSTYQPGSITLDGASLSDAVDTDAGDLTGSNVNVSLGNVAAGQSRSVTFRVRVSN